MKLVHRLIKFSAFLVVLFTVNFILNFIALDYKNAHRWQNKEVCNNPNQYDLMVFGSCEARICFDTKIADDILNISTFNYGNSGGSDGGGDPLLF